MTFKTMLIFLTLLSVSCINEASFIIKKNAAKKQIYLISTLIKLSLLFHYRRYTDTGRISGHAEIVMDVASNKKGEKIFIPAQDVHILAVPVKNQTTPWYYANESAEKILTPEQQFYKSALKQWQTFGTDHIFNSNQLFQ